MPGRRSKPDEAATEPEDTTVQIAGVIRDRVVELRRVPSEDLMDNEANWRVHPYAQRAAVAELLEEVGIVGALTAYESERNGGALTLIDGHERRSHQADWPVLVLDVTDEEADLLLLTLDPVRMLADSDSGRLDALLGQVQAGTPALVDLLQSLGATVDPELAAAADDQGAGGFVDRFLPEMELQPYEHYDYVVLICRNTYDWMSLQDLLGIEQVQFTLPDKKTKGAKRIRQIGMGRVIDAKRVLDKLRAAPAQDAAA